MTDAMHSTSPAETMPPPTLGPETTTTPAAPDVNQSISPRDWSAGGATPAAPRFYMTSDLRAATGLTRTHLDFYLREDLIRPTARTESGYLLFDEAELATLRTIIAWRHGGHGIRQIRERLGR